MTKEIIVLMVILSAVMGSIASSGLTGWRYWLHVLAWATVCPVLAVSLALAMSLIGQ